MDEPTRVNKSLNDFSLWPDSQRGKEMSNVASLGPTYSMDEFWEEGGDMQNLEDLCKVHLTSRADVSTKNILECLYLGSAQGELFFFITWICPFNLINSRRRETGIEKCGKHNASINRHNGVSEERGFIFIPVVFVLLSSTNTHLSSYYTVALHWLLSKHRAEGNSAYSWEVFRASGR